MKYNILLLLFLVSISASSQSLESYYKKQLRNALKGDEYALNYLLEFASGERGPQYVEQTRATYRKTINQNHHAMGGYKFASLFYYKKSIDSSMVYFTKCADLNEKQVSGECALALAHINIDESPGVIPSGHTGIMDLPKAKMWVEKALSLLTNKDDIVRAQKLSDVIRYAMWKPYKDGFEAFQDKNWSEALRLWTHQDEDDPNNFQVEKNIAYLYSHGLGVTQDFYKAAGLYQRAGNHGDSESYMVAGQLFLLVDNGEFVEAIKMFEKALSKGVEAARPLLEETKAKLQYRVDGVMAERAAAASANENKVRYNNTTYTTTADTTNKVICPICNGAGKSKQRYTSEQRDHKTNEVILADHTDDVKCVRCNGTGYISK